MKKTIGTVVLLALLTGAIQGLADPLGNLNRSSLVGMEGDLVFNVKDYGATGDGVSDDTVGIRAALVAAAGTPSIVYFPRGEYGISGLLGDHCLTNSSGVNLVGELGAKIKILDSSPGTGFLLIPEGSVDITIKGLEIDGNHQRLSPLGDIDFTGEGIDTKEFCQYISVENCYIHDFSSEAIDFDGGTNLSVRFCRLEDNLGNAIHLAGNGPKTVYVEGNTIKGNGFARAAWEVSSGQPENARKSAGIDSATGANIQIFDNKIVNNSTGIRFLNNTTVSSIDNNYIVGSVSNAAVIFDGDGSSSSKITMTGNQIYGSSANVNGASGDPGVGILFRNGQRDIRVTGGSIRAVPGIRIEGGCENIHIDGISFFVESNGLTSEKGGVRIDASGSAGTITVENSSFTGQFYSPLKCLSGDLVLRGNYFGVNASVSLQTVGGHVITGNVFDPTKLTVDPGVECLVKNNVFSTASLLLVKCDNSTFENNYIGDLTLDGFTMTNNSFYYNDVIATNFLNAASSANQVWHYNVGAAAAFNTAP